MQEIPEQNLDANEISKLLFENFQILIKAQIVFMSEAKIGMTREQLQKIEVRIYKDFGLPIEMRQEEYGMDQC